MTAVFQSSGRQNWKDLLDKKDACCHGKFWCRSSVPNLVVTLLWTTYVPGETLICYLAVLSEESTFIRSLHSKLLVCVIMHGELKIYRGSGTHIVYLLKMLKGLIEGYWTSRENVTYERTNRLALSDVRLTCACSERTRGNLALCLPTGCTA